MEGGGPPHDDEVLKYGVVGAHTILRGPLEVTEAVHPPTYDLLLIGFCHQRCRTASFMQAEPSTLRPRLASCGLLCMLTHLAYPSEND